jgi:hypothetical protein
MWWEGMQENERDEESGSASCKEGRRNKTKRHTDKYLDKY